LLLSIFVGIRLTIIISKVHHVEAVSTNPIKRWILHLRTTLHAGCSIFSRSGKFRFHPEVFQDFPR